MYCVDLKFGERQRHQLLDAIDHVDVFLSVEQYTNGLVEARLGLDEYLPAGTAGTHGLFLQFPLRVAGSDSQHGDGLVGIFGSGGKDSRAFCTNAGREGGILLITAHEEFAVLQRDGCANMKWE